MKVIIIEDEQAAVERLQSILMELDPGIDIVAVIESVEETVSWFCRHEPPDLLLLDVQLSDGISFEIFNAVKVECPIIFTTAYDQYAIQAFKLNSIDYLMKPIDKHELRNSLKKYDRIKDRTLTSAMRNIDALLESLQMKKPSHKTRFLIKRGDSFFSISCEDIVAFFIEHQLVCIMTKAGRHYATDHTLNEIESMIDPKKFFRINRQMIVALDSIASIKDYFNGRLKLTLTHEIKRELLVSRGKVGDFKAWLGA